MASVLEVLHLIPTTTYTAAKPLLHELEITTWCQQNDICRKQSPICNWNGSELLPAMQTKHLQQLCKDLFLVATGQTPHRILRGNWSNVFTTTWQSVDRSAPLITRVSQTRGCRSDDTVKCIINLWPRVLWCHMYLYEHPYVWTWCSWWTRFYFHRCLITEQHSGSDEACHSTLIKPLHILLSLVTWALMSPSKTTESSGGSPMNTLTSNSKKAGYADR